MTERLRKDDVKDDQLELPDDLGAVTIVDGQIVGMYRDPAVAEDLKLHSAGVEERAKALQEHLAARATAEVLSIWESTENGVWVYQAQNPHGHKAGTTFGPLVVEELGSSPIVTLDASDEA